MSLKLYEESNVRDIANAIRAKNGSTDTYAIGEMAAAVSGLTTGGSDSVLENAKETGGIGWTDSTPQTITVEWDGNTEGLIMADVYGEAFYKISDKTPTIADLVNAKVTLSDDSEYTIEDGALVELNGIIQGPDGGYFFIATKDGASIGSITFPEKGIYFVYTADPLLFTSKLSWSVTEIVYKINQKYLPDKADCITVNLTVTEQVSEYVMRATANKTHNEIMSEVMKGKTNLFMTLNGEAVGLLAFSSYLDDYGIVFTGILDSNLIFVVCDDPDKWTLTIWEWDAEALAYASEHRGIGWVETTTAKIDWDGDKTGKTPIGIAWYGGYTGAYYKVSDLTPPDTDLVHSDWPDFVQFNSGSSSDLSLENYDNIYTKYGMVTSDFSMLGPCVIVIRTANTAIDPTTIKTNMGDDSTYLSYVALQEAATFPETGIYFFFGESDSSRHMYVKYIYCDNLDVVRKIDPKYLPDNISVDLTGYAKTEDLPSKTSQLTNDSGFLTLADLPVYNGEVSNVTEEVTS